ncbi:hypothetical protein [Streptomyces sp. NBC_00859]|nr:hypothetical protein OG584_27165 [Streptomyces sp. NBC_00859]
MDPVGLFCDGPAAGFTAAVRREPVDTGYFRLVLIAKVARHDDK